MESGVDASEVKRFVQNHGKKIELKVLEEMLWALQDEVNHAIRDNREEEPKKREAHRNPSLMHIIGDVLHAYFQHPQAWRDEFRRRGRADRHERQRSPVPIKIDPGGSLLPGADPHRRGNVHPRPGGGSIGRGGRRRDQDGRGDRQAIGHDGIPLA